MTDWLLGQLPQVMQDNDVIGGFVRGCGEITETIRDRLDGLEHELDVNLAGPQMLQYLAAWLGLQLDALPTAEQDSRAGQRRLIRAVAATLGWRGTRFGTEELLRALTGGRAEVRDAGGVWVHDDPPGPPDPTVTVVLDTYGPLTRTQVERFLAAELPVGCVPRIVLRSEFGRG